MGHDFRLCLVTDRRRLAAAAGRGIESWRDLLMRQTEGAVAAGVDFVQVREQDLDARSLRTLVSALVSIVQASRTQVLVNDRLDVARAADAAGVHLRHDSIPPALARNALPVDAVVTRAVHAAGDIDDLSGISYFVAGTLCRTASKAAGAAILGEDGLAAIVRCAAPLPVLAIGGVSPAMVSALIRAGAAGAAAIGAFLPEWPGDDPASAVQRAALAFRAAVPGAVAPGAAGATR